MKNSNQSAEVPEGARCKAVCPNEGINELQNTIGEDAMRILNEDILFVNHTSLVLDSDYFKEIEDLIKLDIGWESIFAAYAKELYDMQNTTGEYARIKGVNLGKRILDGGEIKLLYKSAKHDAMISLEDIVTAIYGNNEVGFRFLIITVIKMLFNHSIN